MSPPGNKVNFTHTFPYPDRNPQIDKKQCDCSFEEFSSETLIEIQDERMRPGQLSADGFLLNNESIMTVYQSDKDYLKSVNITYDQCADIFELIQWKKKRIKDIAMDRFKLVPVIDYAIDGIWQCDTVKWMGAQECPFQQKDNKKYYGHQYGDADMIITNIKAGFSTIVVNTLLPHIIRNHHFFEGNVSNRVSPANIIGFFDLQPNVDYSIAGNINWVPSDEILEDISSTGITQGKSYQIGYFLRMIAVSDRQAMLRYA
jgi:hypothetical protein